MPPHTQDRATEDGDGHQMPEGVGHYKGFQRGYDGYATVVHGLILGITTSYFKKMIEAKT